MKVWKLILGIISINLLAVSLQPCVVGVGNIVAMIMKKKYLQA